MRIIKPTLFKITFVAVTGLALLAGCTYTSTTSDSPELSIDMASFKRSIDSLSPNEGMNLSTTATNANGFKTSSVSVEIINGKNIPSDETGVNDLGKKIALKLKHSLKNPAQYDKYGVIFNTEKSSGGFTESRKVSYECDSKDL
ncbi:hypothetical protein ACTHGU_20495 [Chitinophagaceae bacterium MMS25-I14]